MTLSKMMSLGFKELQTDRKLKYPKECNCPGAYRLLNPRLKVLDVDVCYVLIQINIVKSFSMNVPQCHVKPIIQP